MSTAAAGLLLFLNKDLLVKDHVFIAAAALLVYDYIITIYSEVIMVWFSPWTYTKVLFLVTRYIPLANIGLFLFEQFAIDASPDVCLMTYQANSWLYLVGIIFAETILMIRTWAVWRRDKIIGLFLCAVMVAGTVLWSVYCNQLLKSVIAAQPPYPGFGGCFLSSITNSSSSLTMPFTQSFIILAVIDAVVLVLMMVSAFRAYRSGNNLELSNVVHRDAILFYVFMMICSTSNVIVAYSSPSILIGLLTPLQGTIHSILACRIVLNIRSMAYISEPVMGLHMGYREMRIIPLGDSMDEQQELNLILERVSRPTAQHRMPGFDR